MHKAKGTVSMALSYLGPMTLNFMNDIETPTSLYNLYLNYNEYNKVTKLHESVHQVIKTHLLHPSQLQNSRALLPKAPYMLLSNPITWIHAVPMTTFANSGKNLCMETDQDGPVYGTKPLQSPNRVKSNVASMGMRCLPSAAHDGHKRPSMATIFAHQWWDVSWQLN